MRKLCERKDRVRLVVYLPRVAYLELQRRAGQVPLSTYVRTTLLALGAFVPHEAPHDATPKPKKIESVEDARKVAKPTHKAIQRPGVCDLCARNKHLICKGACSDCDHKICVAERAERS